ncbi:hypothetical protein M3Y99_00291100 [Aphelenchoides fujianensis]|nr:hypothetical protein M3Y99_00291100 [Aphelenchoides fujianensis]
MVAIDVSTTLKEDHFNKEIDFLSYNVFTDEWTDLDRLTLVQYDEEVWLRPFAADETASDVRQQLRDTKRLTPANLTRALETIDRWQSKEAEEVVHLIVFVSKINKTLVHACLPFVQSLQLKNYELKIVAVGGLLNASLLLELSPNVIQWDVERQNVPTGWSSQFWTAYGCGDESCVKTTIQVSTSVLTTRLSTTESSSPPSSCPQVTCPTPSEHTCPTVPTQTPTPTVPACQKGTFAVMQDRSGFSLNSVEFQASVDFVRKTLYEAYDQIEQFWYGYYAPKDSWIGNFSDYTPKQFDHWLDRRFDQDKYDAALINQTAAVLRAKGVRLVLLALDLGLDADLMAQLAGDRDSVQFWDPLQQAEPPNFQRWFNYTVEFGCFTKEALVPCADQGGLQINLLFDLNQDSISEDRAEWNPSYGINYYRQAYVAFAGSLTDEDVYWIQGASSEFHGPLTVVALNKDVKTTATKAGLNVIDWSDPTASAPVDWKRALWAAFGCAGSPPSGR